MTLRAAARWLLLGDLAFAVVRSMFAWRYLRDLRCAVRVTRSRVAAGEVAPRVAILVPARNEERSIEACVSSLLAQDYPRERLRVHVMDDRSSDETPRILERLAQRDERLMVLHGEPLPPGWKGKCWALHQAAQHVEPTTDYLLFVDADTVHEPWMLASVVSLAAQERVDLLSLAPRQELGSLAERLLLPSIFAIIMSARGTVVEVNDPRRADVAKAVGQFMLFRTAAYRALGGHAAVRDEIVEDFALARQSKWLGQRVLLADGRDVVSTRMYRALGEIWQGFSKNAFDEAQRQPGGALPGLLLLPFAITGPYLLLALGLGGGWRHRGVFPRLLLGESLAQVLLMQTVGWLGAAYAGVRGWYGLAHPVAGLFFWAVLVNSTWRTLTGRGVAWKGRTYH